MKIAAAAVRAFAHRNRGRVQAAKRAHWARTARATPKVAVALAHALYEHAKVVSPGFPSERSRDDDFAHHQRLKGLIDRAAHSLPELVVRNVSTSGNEERAIASVSPV